MFFPRKIAEARSTGLSRSAVEAFAAKVRAQLLEPEGGDVRKVLANLGGTIEKVAVARNRAEDDFMIARSKNEFTVGLVEMGSLYQGESFEPHDCARALGHMLIHYPMHLKREGSGTAMAVTRYPSEEDLEGTFVAHEGNWFAWELIAPVAQVARTYADIESGTEDARVQAVARRMGVAARTVKSQVRRARALGLVAELAEAA